MRVMFETMFRKVFCATARFFDRRAPELHVPLRAEIDHKSYVAHDRNLGSMTILDKAPAFAGEVGDEPAHLRGARILCIGVLKPETERSSVLPFLAEIRDRAGADLDRWNAVWSDRYFIGWTVVTGTHTEFLAQGILPPESSGKSDIFVATRDLRFEWAPVQAGRRPYSSTHEELQEAIGAMIYEYNRLAAGFQAQRAELAEPAYGEIAGFEDLAPEWQDLSSVLFHFSKRKGEDWDETIWRRFRRELGASRMRVLHGEAPSSKELEVGARLVTEGRHLALTSTSKKFRDTKRAKLLLEDLGAFISLLHRESRLQAQGVNAINSIPMGTQSTLPCPRLPLLKEAAPASGMIKDPI